jgi:DHHC palmitoyltransferase
MSSCVGERNYKAFFVCIASGSVILLIYSMASLYAFSLYFSNTEYFMGIVSKWAATDTQVRVFVAGSFIYFMITFGIFVGIFNLFIFHARLAYIGMTTVSYLESRSARGPLLWEINRKEYRRALKEAKQHHESTA